MLPSLWTAIYVELSPEDALRRLASLGWPAVELSTEHLEVLRDSDDRAARLRGFASLARDLGLEMPQAHITLQVDIASMDPLRRNADQSIVRRDIEVLAELGIGNGVLHPGGSAHHESWDAANGQNDVRKDAIAELASVAEDAGVRLALENGCWSFGPGDATAWDGSVRGIRRLIGEVGSPALGICLDTGHAILEQWDPAEAVRVAGDLLIATHIADNDGSGDQHRIPYSYGSKVDWGSVVAALDEIGYQGLFNLEIPGERRRPYPFIDCAARYGLDVCRALLAGSRHHQAQQRSQGAR